MIKMLILDIDGVMTDGTKDYNRQGEVVVKKFCDKDWTAIKRFKALGVQVVCITGDPFNELILKNRQLPVILSRGKGFHSDKSIFLPEICQQYQVRPEEVAFIGDDLFDAGLMKAVGHPYCVADAPRAVKAVATPLPVPGGANALMILFETLEERGLVPSVTMEEVMHRIYELDIRETF